MSAFHELQSSTQLLLEHPSLTALHKNLVVDGNFMAAEAVLQRASEEQLFHEYITEAPYRPEWKRINATDASITGYWWCYKVGPLTKYLHCTDGESPCMRGGHQMCIDVEVGGQHVAVLFLTVQRGPPRLMTVQGHLLVWRLEWDQRSCRSLGIPHSSRSLGMYQR